MKNNEQLRQQVIQYFRSVGSGQNIVQCIKEALFLHQRFSPLKFFEILSRGKQKMTVEDLRTYLINHQIRFNESQLRYYLQQNGFKSEITFNDFLEAMIPFNADVVRQFKGQYLDRLKIKVFDPEVQFIINELFDNQLKFYRSLINIREEISKIATKKQIQKLIKDDLKNQSKPRERQKFVQKIDKQKKEKKIFQLGFHQLRKFLQLWVSSKQILHQFYLLNVMRHLRSNQPFQKIVIENKRGKSASAKKRPHSAMPKNKEVLMRQKIYGNYQEDLKYQGRNDFNSGQKQEKYNNYKNQVINEYIKQRQNVSDKKTYSPLKQQSKQVKQDGITEQQKLRRSKYDRLSKGVDPTYLLQILEEIVIKQERLQKLRVNLAKLTDFNLINLFNIIDVRHKGYVSPKDIADYTGIQRIQYNSMVNFYAREYQKLRFNQFCLIFRPLSKQLNQDIDRRPQHKVPDPFKRETTKLITQVITLTADMHANIGHIKQNISRSGIDLKQYFRFVDLQDKGYISARCFHDVLNQNNIFCDNKDLKCLMKLFRKKVDQKIKLTEFIDFLDL